MRCKYWKAFFVYSIVVFSLIFSREYWTDLSFSRLDVIFQVVIFPPLDHSYLELSTPNFGTSLPLGGVNVYVRNPAVCRMFASGLAVLLLYLIVLDACCLRVMG
jgi:hypothetical protein